MARPTLVDRLRHVLEAIAQIETYLTGKSFADYLVDDMRRHAVERCLEIASEASRHIPSESKGRFPEILGVALPISALRHEYPNVINERVWQIVTSDLAPLKSAVEDMLREAEAGSGR